jgi:3-oxoacyl-[acyl-carrier protein] reductase
MTRTALITGAGRNIGRAVALALAGQGMNVVINGSSDQAACDRVADEARALGVQALVAMGDVGDRATCRRLVEFAITRFGRVDVLVNNAALRPTNKFLDLTEEDYRRVMAVDLEAAIWLAQACLPGMVAEGWGRIVNFAGMNAIHGYAGRAPVSVAKHGVWGLTKSLGKEFGPKGVTVNAISPGPIASDDEDVAPDAHRQEMVVRVPVGRLGQPAEVAAMVRLLASDEGAFINGQMLAVNGGAET